MKNSSRFNSFFTSLIKRQFSNYYITKVLSVTITMVLVILPGLSFGYISGIPVQEDNIIEAFKNGNTNFLTPPDAITSSPSSNYSDDGWLNVKKMGASGSLFETTATVAASSNQVTVADAGDFQVGQQVIISKANIRYINPQLRGMEGRTFDDAVELRGYDGSSGNWVAYILEVDGADPLTFRWKGDISKPWDGEEVPITFEWQKLNGGVEILFKRQKWEIGNMITFSARDQLEATIQKIEGNIFTLADPANHTASGAIVRHTDRAVLQKIINIALENKLNIFFPAGHYRIPGGLQVVNAEAITIEGANAQTTVLDISDGAGSCFRLQGGTEVTIRNFSMVGHTGMAEASTSFTMMSGYTYWPNNLKGCGAINMTATERTLIENVHASRMASEAFYARGPQREGKKEPEQYQKSLTYLRCSVTDCAANAFNNNDTGENTSILYCRVDGAAWHAAEMPARFLKVIGCYFRNTGAVTVGDMSHRYEHLNELGCGQAFICNNVFEGSLGRAGGIDVTHGSSQIVISGNVFVNYNGNAITINSYTVRPPLSAYEPGTPPTDWGGYPSRSVVISNNIIDMTCTDGNSEFRRGIYVNASNVTIANNQIYVRGKADPSVNGMQLLDPALNLTVHDNLISNCGTGILTGRAGSSITQVVTDSHTFRESGLPLEWRYTHQYQDWNLLWIKDNKVTGSSLIDSYDPSPSALTFKLKSPYDIKVGDDFEVYYSVANWNIHDNTITGCKTPVIFNNYGSKTNRFHQNIIDRGRAEGVTAAVTVGGLYQLTSNQIIGFDEPGSCGLLLMPDRQNNPLPNIYRDNLFTNCTVGIKESKKGLWKAATRDNNSFIDCRAELGK